MVVQVAKRLSDAYFSFRHSVNDAQRIAHHAVEKMANLTLETSSDIMTMGWSQLDSMRRVMTVPEVFAIQSSLLSSLGQTCLEHVQLSMEEVIETQINLNNLVGHSLDDYSPIFRTMGIGITSSSN
ncbi:MAG: phasin family protein [Magnetococcales bacterium]|nr:phasin family protein [Magnetococcales bacterium]MBF0149670.1 phasin family protein [Magnetococcales bacterium]MBF0172516.1 phasin family protein [Magnetococcales bacterium]MBF0631813.1 phasin family protein [Magnetococcales bacterium]